jgi:hypothetical protein
MKNSKLIDYLMAVPVKKLNLMAVTLQRCVTQSGVISTNLSLRA